MSDPGLYFETATNVGWEDDAEEAAKTRCRMSAKFSASSVLLAADEISEEAIVKFFENCRLYKRALSLRIMQVEANLTRLPPPRFVMVDIRPEGSIPITVFTGFLGAGKTSIILSLLPRLPKDYKAVLLKNEFGDVEVDSKLAEQSSLAGVSEITNGCMCCVMVGRMENALLEIRDQYHPDRIFIECSGSAFPATLAFQLRELERRTSGELKLDAICTVIDAENFEGYEDTSPTARMQASYSDILIVNKWEDVSERKLDDLYDKLNTLNDGTPKIRSQGKKGVDPSLIFGLESKLFASSTPEEFSAFDHNHEVQTVTLTASSPFTREHLFQGLDRLSKESIWRVKGFVRQPEGVWILNWAFGRHDLTAVGMEASREYLQADVSLKLTVMGEHGEVKRSIRKFAESLSAIVV